MTKRGILTILFVVFAITGAAGRNGDTPVISLLERHSPEASKRFVFEITDTQSNKDFFTLSTAKNKVHIGGNNNLSLAAGLNYYLKNYLGVSLTPHNTAFELPKQLPEITKPIRRETEITTRLSLNNESYKGERAYWGFTEWQREIDLMALSGVNMAYIPIGSGTAMRNALLSMGVDEDAVAAFLPMPSYYAWWADDQCDGGSYELPLSWYEGERELMKNILSELQKWNIDVIAQGYNGTELPAKLSEEEFAKRYYDEIQKLYGDITYFRVNTAEAAKRIDRNAVWVYDIASKGASAEEVAALPRGNVLLIGRYADLTAWDKTGASGHHNFILRPKPEERQENLYNREYRNRLLFSGLELIDNDRYGINAHYISSYIWDNTLPYADCIKLYVKHTYGQENPVLEKAIETMERQLMPSVRPFIYSEPILPETSPDLAKTTTYIDVLKSFAGEAAKFANNANYQHDLILYTQEAVYKRAAELAKKTANSVDTRSSEFFKKESEKFLSLLLMLDKLYYTRPEFRYDLLLETARAKGATYGDKGVYEGDVRRYTTIWGDRYTSNMLRRNDSCYSAKSGILADYYHNRWYIYFKSLEGILNNKIEGDIDYYGIGKEWSEKRNTFPEQPKSSTILRAVEIINYLNSTI